MHREKREKRPTNTSKNYGQRVKDFIVSAVCPLA
jgi:hypothetical protein